MTNGMFRPLYRIAPAASMMAVLAIFAMPVKGVTIWTDWTAATPGANGGGSASGTLGGVTVTYSGELDSAVINGTSNIWAPASSFLGGTVTATPAVPNDDLRLNGSSTAVNTITFGSPLVNPVFAIWSLGSPSAPASFTFGATPTLEAGGPNSEFGGSSITVSGNVVSGREGNGVVQFTGTLSSITWTDTFENFYAFTVGMNGPVSPPAVPEPGTWALALAGLGLVGFSRLRKRA
jgi:hypothetical protein